MAKKKRDRMIRGRILTGLRRASVKNWT
jgi:hypothetical protein